MAIETKEINAARERARDNATGAEQPKLITMQVDKLVCTVLESDVSEYEKYGYRRLGPWPLGEELAKKVFPKSYPETSAKK